MITNSAVLFSTGAVSQDPISLFIWGNTAIIGPVLLVGIVGIGWGWFCIVRKRLSRKATDKLYKNLIRWDVIPYRYETQIFGQGGEKTSFRTKVYADSDEPETRHILLSWSRMLGWFTLYFAIVLTLSCIIAEAAIFLLIWLLPYQNISNVSSVKQQQLVHAAYLLAIWAFVACLGIYISVSLALRHIEIRNADIAHLLTPEIMHGEADITDYRSPWVLVFITSLLIVDVLLIVFTAPPAFFHPQLASILIACVYPAVAILGIVGCERFLRRAVNVRYGALGVTGTMAPTIADALRRYAVTCLMCLQAGVITMLALVQMVSMLAIPGVTSSVSDSVSYSAAYLWLIFFVFLSIVPLCLISSAKGHLGGRVTGWSRAVDEHEEDVAMLR